MISENRKWHVAKQKTPQTTLGDAYKKRVRPTNQMVYEYLNWNRHDFEW